MLSCLREKGIETFYHDCHFGANPVHATFEQLCKYPDEIRRRMYLMHYGELPPDMCEADMHGMTQQDMTFYMLCVSCNWR